MKFNEEEFEVLFCGLAKIEEFARALEIESVGLKKETEKLIKTIESTYNKLSKMEKEEIEVID